MSTTSPTRNWERPSPTGFTTCPRTPAGSASGSITTLPRSPWPPCGPGGTPSELERYPDADRLLICADGGGSNGSRVRAWKVELAAFAADTGLRITVAHLPPGTSKWNKIEHRLFSQITLNWRGRPLTSHQVIVDTIANTTTETGLTVRCVLDTGQYPTGIKYTPQDVEALPLQRHDFHPDWNYTLHPTDTPD